MKRMLPGITAIVMLVTMAGSVYPQRNPRGKAKLDLGGKSISIEYGQPSLHGRTVYEMFNKLPADGVWRLGADTSTTFSTSGDLIFGGMRVPQGIYSLWAHREADKSWKLVFNSQHGQPGTQHDSKLDVAQIPLKESRAADPPDEITIVLTKAKKRGMIAIEWGELRLYAEFD